MKLSKIKTNPSNPRNIRGERLEALKKSVVDDAWMRELREIVVDENMMILGGNMRYQALKAVGIKEVPDSEIKIAKGLTEEQKRRFVILDNASFGDWDFDILANAWDDLPLADWLDLPDFEAVETEPIEEDEAAVGEMIDKAEELNKKWKVKTGDLWQIGRHRLLVDDCRAKENIKKLVEVEVAQMVFADPPYGIEIVSAERAAVGGAKPFGSIGGSNIIDVGHYSPIIGDETTETAIDSYLLAADLFPKAAHIWWGGNYYANALPPSSCWIIWDKENTGNFADAELAWTNQKTAVRIFKHQWNGLIKESERGQKRVHPTQKPIALAEWCFEKYGNENDLIFDPFLGSGMSMAAAERTNRKVFGCEMSENYAAVILERLTNLGLEAKRID